MTIETVHEATRTRDIKILQHDYEIQSGQKIYTTLRHMSKSGMMRVYDVYIVHGGEIERITFSVARVIGYTYNHKHDGIQVGGTGFDGGDAIVSDLSYALFGNAGTLQYVRL